MDTDDFFRSRLDTMIDWRHPLAVLATRMQWDLIDKSLAPLLAHKDRAGRRVEGGNGLFGPTVAWPVRTLATRAARACRGG